MPAFETMDLNDWLVLWEKAGNDGYGNPTLAAPVQIRCRWIEGQTEFTGPNGVPIAINATIVVARDIPVDSIVWKGRLQDMPGTGYVPTGGLMQIKGKRTTDDIKGRNTRRTVMAARFNDTLPARV